MHAVFKGQNQKLGCKCCHIRKQSLVKLRIYSDTNLVQKVTRQHALAWVSHGRTQTILTCDSTRSLDRVSLPLDQAQLYAFCDSFGGPWPLGMNTSAAAFMQYLHAATSRCGACRNGYQHDSLLSTSCPGQLAMLQQCRRAPRLLQAWPDQHSSSVQVTAASTTKSYRLPVGLGPSLKTWPRWAPLRASSTSTRLMKGMLLSVTCRPCLH